MSERDAMTFLLWHGNVVLVLISTHALVGLGLGLEIVAHEVGFLVWLAHETSRGDAVQRVHVVVRIAGVLSLVGTSGSYH